MKVAVCPNNREHKKFFATAHVTQEWLVDAKGRFIREVKSCLEVTQDPDPDNTWTCAVCGAEAVFEDKECETCGAPLMAYGTCSSCFCGEKVDMCGNEL